MHGTAFFSRRQPALILRSPKTRRLSKRPCLCICRFSAMLRIVAGTTSTYLLLSIRFVEYYVEWIALGIGTRSIDTDSKSFASRQDRAYREGGSLTSILASNGKRSMRFPSHSEKEIRAQLWECTSSWFPHCLPQRSDVEVWYRLMGRMRRAHARYVGAIR